MPDGFLNSEKLSSAGAKEQRNEQQGRNPKQRRLHLYA